jgi:hypothetical protein
MKFSLFFFDGDGSGQGSHHHRLFIDSAKFASAAKLAA